MGLIHSTRFTLPDESLWFGKARLYEDRIELRGWSWSGRFERTIPLEDVERAEWWTHGEGTNFALFMEDGATVALKLRRAAGTWKFEIDSLLGSSSFQGARLPDEASQKDAAA